ncbi:hypothetical protein LIX60_03505 [Streptomyces sp. S07_1.15]|uniref:hypothetical protein n=1 Tax=Streptomyces sp. S07_1.15 TaxID=2873925 RepID=UPI001D141768|nr:hypothetical protein [Streptomyces sp. S07_1.15]MCC3650578.1 hypothetical protein [Streptomyces sp. S07_1.15]
MNPLPCPVSARGRVLRRSPSSLRTLAASVLTLTVMVLVGGCGGTGASAGGQDSGTPSARPPAARPASVEELASAVDCTADITTDVDDYRQGICTASKARYVFVSFTTAKGQRDWLEYAQMYGGVYLVGNRWVVAADPKKYLDRAREKLGGTIEKTAAFGADPTVSSPSTAPRPSVGNGP